MKWCLMCRCVMQKSSAEVQYAQEMAELTGSPEDG
jgi:hypothetical protein